jgi:type IV pilus assembly protein PilA
MQTKTHGFTLIELMCVISIIGILAMAAIPSYTDYLQRAKVSEAFMLASSISKTIADYYSYHGKLPKNNLAADLPAPENLGGQHVKSIEIENGAIHMNFDSFERDKKTPASVTLTLRPAIVVAYPPTNALIWVCGYASAIKGMIVIGDNKTDIEQKYLPSVCLQPKDSN